MYIKTDSLVPFVPTYLFLKSYSIDHKLTVTTFLLTILVDLGPEPTGTWPQDTRSSPKLVNPANSADKIANEWLLVAKGESANELDNIENDLSK